mgnify:CR=1 FL=1
MSLDIPKFRCSPQTIMARLILTYVVEQNTLTKQVCPCSSMVKARYDMFEFNFGILEFWNSMVKAR